MLHEEVRREVMRVALSLYHQGLVHLTSGNVSARASSERVAITPTRVSYETMRPEDIVIVDLSGTVVDGYQKPSSETSMHTHIFRARHDVNGVIHTHSTYALALAVLGREIPLLCTEGLAIGGPVPVAEYACSGTAAVGEAALRALEGPPPVKGVLLPNHGVLTIGGDLERALTVACHVEILARVYHLALQVGEPVAFTEEQIVEMRSRYRSQ